MATDTLPTRTNGQTIDQTWFANLQAVLGTDFVPRNSSGVATDLAGNLGEAALRFLTAKIAAGYWAPGDYKMHNSYNGAVPAGEGWMLCDGRQVTQAAYDTEHGSGHWATYITQGGTLSCPLLNLHLPDFTANNGILPVGAATTPQDGSGAITRTGNARIIK